MEQNAKNWPRIYVASRYAGDVHRNVANAAKACRYVAKQKKIPIATHLMFPNMGFDDNDPDERRMCLQFGHSLISICDEVWCFVSHNEISEGMRGELDMAQNLRIPIRFFDVDDITE